MHAELNTSRPTVSTHTSATLTAVPLLHAAWLFAVGIAIAHAGWLRPSFVLVALAPVALLCGIAAVRAQRVVWLALAIMWCLLGIWCAEMEPRPAPSQNIVALSDGLLRTVEGTITVASPVRGELQQNVDEFSGIEPTQSIDLRLANIEVVTDEADAATPVKGGVRLTVRWPQRAQGIAVPRPFRCGERIRATVRLLTPEIYRDPGVFSRADYLLEQDISSTASVNIDRVESLGTATGECFPCRVAGWQHASSARLLSLPAVMRRLPAPLRLSEEDAIMLAAMATGDRTYLTRSLRVGFERTGSFHMLVVSGFHLAILAACFFWIARRLRLPRVPATIVTIAASTAYALFTGFATPVQRSLLMITLYLLASLFYRQRNALNTIGFASLCLLALSPHSLFESSLQMTLLAVVAIGGIAAPLLQKTVHPYVTAMRDLHLTAIDIKLAPQLAQFRVVMRMLAAASQRAFSARIAWSLFPWLVKSTLRAVEVLVVSIVVELAMTLPMALYFHRITLLALPVNIFILPLLLVLMPAALLTLLMLFIWPAAAAVPAMAVAVLLHIGVGLVRHFSSLAIGDMRVPTPLLIQSLAFCALLAVAVMLARRANMNDQRWLRLAAWAALVLAAVAVVVPRPMQHSRQALLVEAIDVGQGDSLLLITPDGKTLLVDGGGFGGGPRQAPQEFDIGEEVVSQVLWARGIRHLDAVALSHAHSDHMGGLPAVLRNFKPAELWVGNNPPVVAYTALLDEAASLHVRVRTLSAGDDFTLGNAKVNVLAPFRDYQPGNEPGNNDSLVLHVAYGGTSVLLEGDAEAPIEQAMLSESGLESTLLKVGHHGSVTSTQPAFLARVAPQFAVISCGLHNRYGHPRPEILAALEAAGTRTYVTDINGAACFSLDGKNVVPDPFCGLAQLP